MNKIDEQPDRGSHTVGGAVAASAQWAPSLPGSQAIIVETSAVPAMELRSEHDASIQVVASKTTSRRAWLRRGVAVASPVVATLVSAPVYACVNVGPSGFISNSTFASRHPKETVCTFLGPTSWYNNLGVWPASATTRTGNTTTAVKFKDAFSLSGNLESGITGNTTLNDVLGNNSLGNKLDLAKYSIAAYLHAKAGTSDFPLRAEQTIAVYKSYRPVVSVQPPLVATWTEEQTVTWLKTLMLP